MRKGGRKARDRVKRRESWSSGGWSPGSKGEKSKSKLEAESRGIVDGGGYASGVCGGGRGRVVCSCFQYHYCLWCIGVPKYHLFSSVPWTENQMNSKRVGSCLSHRRGLSFLHFSFIVSPETLKNVHWFLNHFSNFHTDRRLRSSFSFIEIYKLITISICWVINF